MKDKTNWPAWIALNIFTLTAFAFVVAFKGDPVGGCIVLLASFSLMGCAYRAGKSA